MRLPLFKYLVLVCLVLAAQGVVSGQHVVVKTRPLYDGHSSFAVEHRPMTAWRRPDGKYCFPSDGEYWKAKLPYVISVDPETGVVLNTPLSNPSSFGGNDSRVGRAAFTKQEYCAIRYTSSNSHFEATDPELEITDLNTGKSAYVEFGFEYEPQFVDANDEIIVLSSQGDWLIRDIDNEWKKIEKDTAIYRQYAWPTFILYGRGNHQLIYTSKEKHCFGSHDGGRTWFADSTLLPGAVSDAARDDANGRWYCTISGELFEVDSNFSVSKVDTVVVPNGAASLQVHNGTFAFSIWSYEGTSQFSVHWNNGNKGFIPYNQTGDYWGHVAIVIPYDA